MSFESVTFALSMRQMFNPFLCKVLTMKEFAPSTKIMNEAEYQEFQSEMNRLASIKFNGYRKTLDEIGVSYLALCNNSAKLLHNETLSMSTYGLYLASADACGINVCPNNAMCRESCLVGSGYAKIDALSNNNGVLRARIIKTRLFFANKPLFMQLLIMEINKAQKKAMKDGKNFSVRLNCTSDISPLAFVYEGKNILEIFPDVQFYDYTKVPKYLELVNRYPNYYVTFSRDGSEENDKVCMEYLANGGNVAVVFGVTKQDELPKKWRGYDVLCGDLYDYRPWDKISGKQVVGLSYKIQKNDFVKVNGVNKFQGIPNIPFIVQLDNEDCKW